MSEGAGIKSSLEQLDN
jgi:protein associated with RNAse G/E